MAPSVLQLSTIWFLPESPRWLISNDRDTDALAALAQYHGDGEETELVKLEYEEIRAAIEYEKGKLYPSSPGRRCIIPRQCLTFGVGL
jgi:hypothetical protein